MTARPDRRSLLGGIAALSVVARPAWAAWPAKPITILHGFGVGGNADVVARIIADGMSKRMKHSFVVESRTGAGGTIAAGLISRAAPDGHTLGILPGGHAVAAAIFRKLAYQPVDGFTPLSMISEFPFVLATHNGHSAKSMAEMLAYAKKAPEPPIFGTPGNGTGQHMAAELLASLAGVSLKHLPYRGGNAGLLDLIGGRIDLLMDTPTVTIEQVRAGKIRALGVTSAKRFFALPDVPTIAEGGVKGYETTSWLGLAGPAGLPADIVARLNSELRAVLAEPNVAAQLQKIGGDPRPTSPQAFRARIAADIAKWEKVVAMRNIKRI